MDDTYISSPISRPAANLHDTGYESTLHPTGERSQQEMAVDTPVSSSWVITLTLL